MKLAPKIIILLLAATFGVMSLYSFYQINRAAKSFNTDAEANHILLLSNSLGFLSKSLWELDKDISIRGMKPLFEAGTIRKIQMYDADGNFFSGIDIKKSAENKVEIVEQDSSTTDKSVNLKYLLSQKKPFDLTPSKMISVMINKSDIYHELVGSLWWKETEFSESKFLGYVILDFSTEYIANRLWEQKITFILFTIGLSFSIIILCYIFLEAQVISPIRKLVEASLDIASGKFSRVQLGKGNDELDKLSKNFNYMVDKIEHSLNLIRGLSEASQVIVKSRSIKESVEIYERYLISLADAIKIEVWLNVENEALDDFKSVIRLSDSLEKSRHEPILEKILSSKEVALESSNANLANESTNYNVIIVPLLNSKNIFMGAVECYYNKSLHRLDEEKSRVIKSLSTSFVTAIENEWHILREKNRANLERDIELASAVQDSIISKNIPVSSLYKYSTFFKTASQCGGDWFGVYQIAEGKILVLFGDVTGHGTPAALITAVTRGASDMLMQCVQMGAVQANSDLPAKVLKSLNECILDTGRQTYLMTMVATLIDFKSQKIYSSSAGHTPPAIISFKGSKHEVKYIYPATGARLGFAKETTYESKEFDFQPGQQIVFYTDGIIEGESPSNREYGLKNFKKSMETHAYQDPEEFVKNVTDDAYSYFAGVPQKDDIALLVIRFLDDHNN
ncbi:SpoIIE family protein phosphatase [Silvanigrella aquatica]|uniref:HAMP domain-containing protein n=1 Tax=Silvanigrella aquatica TaxID=1915309 RepID=A0A1L4D097_9BACT|nr:SpoIIE family protein phosphatase [Silvanigrella aquatica]APJ03610.1 hypothetical protein AXG55_06695 [Silvanigrella aquatica]